MAEPTVLSVSELTRTIKALLDGDERLMDVWVRGEISNFTHHKSGHMYFTLKDASSRIKAVMFASHNRYLAFRPEDGLRVLARGAVSVFERDGQYQLYVREMLPDGIGSLFLAYEQLKERLRAEGLFDRKRPLPAFPRRIGVVTSPSGAAIRDILTTLRRRFPLAHVIIVPVLVQGDEAPASIAAGIERINRYREVDVLIVGRGGGSIEELWAFNEEIVARSIYASSIPVISAVGHETDVTIADFVADLRAPTPTAAAELAVPHVRELAERLGHLEERLRAALRRRVDEERARLNRLAQSPVFRHPRRLVEPWLQHRDQLDRRLGEALGRLLERRRAAHQALVRQLALATPRQRLAAARSRWHILDRDLKRAIALRLRETRQAFGHLLGRLDALSPLKVLQRGYAMVYNETGERVITSVRDVAPGEAVSVRLADGRLDCQVWGIEEGVQHGHETRDYGPFRRGTDL